MPGGESYRDGWLRARSWLEDHAGDAIVVGHGAFNRMFVAAATGADPESCLDPADLQDLVYVIGQDGWHLEEQAWTQPDAGPAHLHEESGMTTETVATQVIANLVVTMARARCCWSVTTRTRRRGGCPARTSALTHPDDAAKAVLADLPGLEAGAPAFHHVDSFRGRRGWHLMFHYLVTASGGRRGSRARRLVPADALPATRSRQLGETAGRRAARLSRVATKLGRSRPE